MKKPQQPFFLVAVKGNKATVIKEGMPAILTKEGRRLKKEPQYRGYYFQLRSAQGFKAKPIWPEGKRI